MKRSVPTILAGLLISTLFAGTALAGGWATTEFDEALPALTEGGSWLIGFTILQHGNHPVAVEGAGLRYTNDESGAVMFFEAEPVGAEGHYAASVGRLSPGTWTLEVEQGRILEDAHGAPNGMHFEPYPVGEITVGKSVAAAVKTPAPKTSVVETSGLEAPSASLPAPVRAAAVEGAESGASILLPVAVALAALGVGAFGIAIRRRGSHSVSGGVEYPSGTSEEVA